MNLLILTEIFLSLVAASVSAPSPMEKTEDSGVEPLDSDQIFLQVVNVPWNLVESDDQQWSLSKLTDSRKVKAQRIREKKAKSRNRRNSFYGSTPGRNSESSYPPSKSDYKRVPVIRKKRPNGSRRQEKKRKKSASESPSKRPNPDRPTLDFGREAITTDRGQYPNSARNELLRRNEGDSPDKVSPTGVSPVEKSPNQVSPESGSVELNEHEGGRNEVENMDFHGEELIKKVGKGIKKVFQKIKNKKEGEEEEEEEEQEKTEKKKLKNKKDEEEDEDEDKDEEDEGEDEDEDRSDYEIDDCDDDSDDIEDEEYESDDCDDSESDSETDSDSDSDSDSDDDCDDPIEGYKAIRIENPGSKPKIIRMKNDPKLNTFDASRPHHSTMDTTASSSSYRNGPSNTIDSTRPNHTFGPKDSSPQTLSSSKSEIVNGSTNHSLAVDKTKHPQKPIINEFQPRKGDIYLPEDENEHTSSGFKYSLPIALLLGGPIMALLVM